MPEFPIYCEFDPTHDLTGITGPRCPVCQGITVAGAPPEAVSAYTTAGGPIVHADDPTTVVAEPTPEVAGAGFPLGPVHVTKARKSPSAKKAPAVKKSVAQ